MLSDLNRNIGNSHIARSSKNKKEGKKMRKVSETINSVRKNNTGIKDDDEYAICLCVCGAFLM